MDRRTFLTEAAVLAALSGVTIRITGCSEDSSPTGGGNPDVVQGTVSTDGNPAHTHAVSIERTTINQGNAVTLNLSFASSHVHTVSLTADEVVQIGQGTRVEATSSDDFGHTHQVTFN